MYMHSYNIDWTQGFAPGFKNFLVLDIVVDISYVKQR